MKTLGELAAKIRDSRSARGWSQEELAQQAGVAVRTVRRVEAGERCHWDTATALLMALERRQRAAGGRALPCQDEKAREA